MTNLPLAVILAAATTWSAFAQVIPCSHLQLDPSLVTEEIVPYRHGEVTDVWTFEVLSDPIVDIQIAPPSDANGPEYLCGIDYAATLAGGLAQLFFYENGFYYVEFEHQSSLKTRAVFWIGVSWNIAPTVPGEAPGSGSGKGKRIDVQTPDIVFFDPTDDKVVAQLDYSGFDGATKKGGDGRESFAEDVCAAFDANGMMPVDVSLLAHGFPGTVLLNGLSGDTLDVPTPQTAFSWGESVSGKIGHIEILSCGSAQGPLGEELLCGLADGSGGSVSGWTDCVGYYKGIFGGGHYATPGEKVTKPAVVDEDPEEIDPEETGQSNGLPVSYTEYGVGAYVDLLDALGSTSSPWDLDGSGVVDAVDEDFFFLMID